PEGHGLTLQLQKLALDCNRLRRQLVDFFFSSRRRHTRSKRDWSSDVCSSDLHYCVGRDTRASQRSSVGAVTISIGVQERMVRVRSEERRVGKECRSRGLWEQ